MNQLTHQQQTDFNDQVNIAKFLIERGQETYIELGRTLALINDNEAYLERYDNWGDFCESEFELKGKFCYELIQNAKTFDRVSAIADSDTGFLPKIGSHLRELSKAPEEKQAKALELAIEKAAKEDRQPIAKDYKAAVEELTAKPKVKPKSATPNAPIEGELLDAPPSVPPTSMSEPDEEYEDFEPPEEVESCEPLWMANRNQLDDFRKEINALIKTIKDAPQEPGFELLNQYAARIKTDLDNAKAAINGCIPFSVCPYCLGNDSECDACNGRSWVNKTTFTNAPKEMQDEAKRLPSGGCC